MKIISKVGTGIRSVVLCSLLLALVLLTGVESPRVFAQSASTVRERADDLVHKHYMDGVQYLEAHALGSEAVPYLLDLLNDRDETEFWVNIIVTIGFIEDSTALPGLIIFLDRARGEVDGFEFRALLSVPFAVGCIASNGDSMALAFLTERIRAPSGSPIDWSFKGENINRHLARQSVMGLASSGQQVARTELVAIRGEIDLGTGQPGQEHLLDVINSGLEFMDRIALEGREQVFNPHWDD